MMQLKLSNSQQVALIDDEDFERVSKYTWRMHKRGYVVSRPKIDNKYRHMRLQRFIMNVLDYPYVEVDHINNDKLNNTKSNLRLCNRQQNNINKPKRPGKFSSKYKGVSQRGVKYEANIRYNRKCIYLGLFNTDKEAALAYNKKAFELHGEFAYLNKVD